MCCMSAIRPLTGLPTRCRSHIILYLLPQYLFRCLALGMDGGEGKQALDGYGAICADGTGLGKTFQSIATMWQLMWCAARCRGCLWKCRLQGLRAD